MFVDSHCHLDYPELATDLEGVLARMAQARVEQALCVSVNLEGFPGILSLAQAHPNLYASAGVHPDQPEEDATTVEDLLRAAASSRVVAIGETGLDYFRLESDAPWQRERFRRHIRAARACGKPLIVHTRAAADDTLGILREEGADAVGGVMHCFTETAAFARSAMELGFYISFSGIVTFRNAANLREVAASVPLERMLIETDAPYLAPVPHRGRTNEPSLVVHVAECLATVRGVPVEAIARATSDNFRKLFRIPA